MTLSWVTLWSHALSVAICTYVVTNNIDVLFMFFVPPLRFRCQQFRIKKCNCWTFNLIQNVFVCVTLSGQECWWCCLFFFFNYESADSQMSALLFFPSYKVFFPLRLLFFGYAGSLTFQLILQSTFNRFSKFSVPSSLKNSVEWGSKCDLSLCLSQQRMLMKVSDPIGLREKLFIDLWFCLFCRRSHWVRKVEYWRAG